MEILVPPPPPQVSLDFNFDSTCSSPYTTAPSTPHKFNNNNNNFFFFTSAPSSPTRSIISSNYYCYDDHVSDHTTSSTSARSTIPFDWELKPGTPKSIHTHHHHHHHHGGDIDEENFEFNFSGCLDNTTSLLDADELFHGGQIKIKPLKPPPGSSHAVTANSTTTTTSNSPRSPRSPRSPKTKKNVNDFDPFQAAIEATTRTQQQQRGRRQRSVRKVSRSLSPMRVSDIMFDQEEKFNESQIDVTNASTTANSKSSSNSYVSNFLSSISFSKRNYKKWKLKDLLLFRSASEGRASTSSHDDKTPFTKFGALVSKREANSAMEDSKNASFRSTDSGGSSSRRRSVHVSAHEIHYNAKRAISEELKRKTFLPYKQGLLGCLGFNPGVREISKGIGYLARE